MPDRLLARLLLALAVWTAPAAADDPVEGANGLRISLLTFAPGDIYWQRFGHNALLVRDPARREALVYNYGTFYFEQENFFLNFVRGRMRYLLEETTLSWTLRQYAAEGRWAVEQELALDPVQREALAAFLAWNARPENAEYRYDYFLANCSTRVRDVLDQALGGALRTQLERRPGTGSYRSEVVRLMAPMPALALGMDLGLGPGADTAMDQWQAGFIPMRLMQALRNVELTDAGGRVRPLVSAERQLLYARHADSPPAPPSSLTFLLVGFAAAALVAVLSASRRGAVTRTLDRGLRCAYLLFCGAAGLVLLLGWLATDHWAMAGNHNLLLLNPLWLVLLLPGVRRRSPRPLAAVLGASALLALPVALLGVQPNLHWVLALLPVHGVVLAGFLRRAA